MCFKSMDTVHEHHIFGGHHSHTYQQCLLGHVPSHAYNLTEYYYAAKGCQQVHTCCSSHLEQDADGIGANTSPVAIYFSMVIRLLYDETYCIIDEVIVRKFRA